MIETRIPRKSGSRWRSRDSSVGAIWWVKFNTGIGRQHAYWQPARWVGDLGACRHMSVAVGQHRRARHERPAGRFIGRSSPATTHYGVYVPTRFGGELTIKTPRARSWI